MLARESKSAQTLRGHQMDFKSKTEDRTVSPPNRWATSLDPATLGSPVCANATQALLDRLLVISSMTVPTSDATWSVVSEDKGNLDGMWAAETPPNTLSANRTR